MFQNPWYEERNKRVCIAFPGFWWERELVTNYYFIWLLCTCQNSIVYLLIETMSCCYIGSQIITLQQVSRWKHSDTHQGPSYKFKDRWDLYRKQQDARWDNLEIFSIDILDIFHHLKWSKMCAHFCVRSHQWTNVQQSQWFEHGSWW